MKHSRRNFIKRTAAISMGAMAFSAQSYARIIGANDRVRIGVAGFSDRFRTSLFPAFQYHYKELNFDLVAVSDIWSKRRNDGQAFLKEKLAHDIQTFPNNDELFASKKIDGVFISTPDFQHAMHTIDAVKSGLDVYSEKPFAETMADNRAALKAVTDSKQIVQIGSQRRSGANYQAAAKFIQEGKFGNITMVELTWNVNQPGRWRRPELVDQLRDQDTDWKRFLLNRPYEPFDARKHIEYRLFWPYSSGLPGQWMSHQIDTVHWFTGLKHPRSVVANGGIYQWKDGRTNWDTLTAVFDYGPADDLASGFQVTFQSRMHNGDDDPSEIYYSNGGELNLVTNKVSPTGGLTDRAAKPMKMSANLLPTLDLTDTAVHTASAANTGGDPTTSAHVRNWMECILSRKEPHAPVTAGYSHSIANIMTTAATHTGAKATFDETTQEVMVGGKPFQY